MAWRGVAGGGGPGERGRFVDRGANSLCLGPSAISLRFCSGSHVPMSLSPCTHRPPGRRLHLPRGPGAQVQAGPPARPAPELRGPDLEADPAPAHQDQLRGLLLPVQRWVAGDRRLFARQAAALLLTGGRWAEQMWPIEGESHIQRTSPTRTSSADGRGHSGVPFELVAALSSERAAQLVES